MLKKILLLLLAAALLCAGLPAFAEELTEPVYTYRADTAANRFNDLYDLLASVLAEGLPATLSGETNAGAWGDADWRLLYDGEAASGGHFGNFAVAYTAAGKAMPMTAYEVFYEGLSNALYAGERVGDGLADAANLNEQLMYWSSMAVYADGGDVRIEVVPMFFRGASEGTAAEIMTPVGDDMLLYFSAEGALGGLTGNPALADVARVGWYCTDPETVYTVLAAIRARRAENGLGIGTEATAWMDRHAYLVEELGFTLTAETSRIAKGKKLRLTPKLTGVKDGDTLPVLYSSSDETIATVDENGVVSAKKKGTVTILADVRLEDGTELTAETELSVFVPTTGLTLSPKKVTLGVGETSALTWKARPADAADVPILWSSSDEGVATVSEDGVVTGIAPGVAKITGVADDGTDRKVACTVTVPSIRATETSYATTVGTPLVIELPCYAADPAAVSVKASNTAARVAFTVEDETLTITVTPSRAGSTTLTVTDKNDSHTKVSLKVKISK